MPVRTGPLTVDSTTIALGLAQIRIGASAANITRRYPVLAASASIGALANTIFRSNVEYFNLESGFPMLRDAVFPLREASQLECGFKEMTPANFALAKGLDYTLYTSAHVGVIPLGAISAPTVLRMEAIYTYPDATNTMNIIFPRMQATAAIEMDFAPEEPAAVAVILESVRADSGISGGNDTWDDEPLGRIIWDDGTGGGFTTTTTTSSSSTTTTTAPP